MKATEIKAGHFYLSKTGLFVREVQQIQGANLYWQDYNYRSGEPGMTGMCTPLTLANWSERELSKDEIERMDRIGASDISIERRNNFVDTALRIATNDELRQELQRRGES